MLEWLRQERCCEFTASLAYIVSFRAAWATVSVSAKQNQTDRTEGWSGDLHFVCFLGETPKLSPMRA